MRTGGSLLEEPDLGRDQFRLMFTDELGAAEVQEPGPGLCDSPDLKT